MSVDTFSTHRPQNLSNCSTPHRKRTFNCWLSILLHLNSRSWLLTFYFDALSHLGQNIPIIKPITFHKVLWAGEKGSYCQVAGWSHKFCTGAARCFERRKTSTALDTWPRLWWCCPRCKLTSSTAGGQSLWSAPRCQSVTWKIPTAAFRSWPSFSLVSGKFPFPGSFSPLFATDQEIALEVMGLLFLDQACEMWAMSGRGGCVIITTAHACRCGRTEGVGAPPLFSRATGRRQLSTFFSLPTSNKAAGRNLSAGAVKRFRTLSIGEDVFTTD